MTPQEIIENNILLAEFIGYIFDDDKNQWYDSKEGLFIGMTLQFNDNWNWLMLVAQKLMKEADQNFCDADLDIHLQNSLATADIEKVYRACIECVKWYNQNKGKLEWKIGEN